MDWLESRAGEQSTSTATGRPERMVIIVEDLGSEWIEELDANFGINPLFVLAYAIGRIDNPQPMKRRLRSQSHPLMISGNSFSSSIKGQWGLLMRCMVTSPLDWEELAANLRPNSWWYQRFFQRQLWWIYHKACAGTVSTGREYM